MGNLSARSYTQDSTPGLSIADALDKKSNKKILFPRCTVGRAVSKPFHNEMEKTL